MDETNQTSAVAVANQDQDILAIIAQAVTSKDVDVAKMRDLFELKKEFEAIRAKQAFAAAMTECQTEIAPVFRESQNASNKSKYAKYEKVDAAIRPVYTRHGFSLSFGTATPSAPGSIKVTCVVRHREGHEERHELEAGIDDSGIKGEKNKTSVQGAGSTVSYLRRYLTGMIFNVVFTNEDNDGQSIKGPKRVTAAQREAIVDALGGPGERVKAFCLHNGLSAVEELGADSFDTAMAQIKAANAKRAA